MQRRRLCGVPESQGAGKTVSASIIIDSLKPYVEQNGYGLAYVYCNYKESVSQTATNLLASLIQQLAQQMPDLLGAITELHETHDKHGTRPSLSELSTVFQALLNHFPHIYVIVDALDECVDTNITHTRSSLLGELEKVHTRIHLLTTSRPGIELELPDLTRLEIRATNDDITTYLDGRIRSETRLKSTIGKDASLHSEIIATVVEKSQGMFLLPKLHMDSLSKKTNRKTLRAALDKLPKEIDQTYDEAMQRIQNQEEEEVDLAQQTLMWIVFARRPLTSLELRHALAVEIGQRSLDEDALVDEDILESVCAGLVTIDKESSTIRLVHYTAQEYFKHTYSRYFPDAYSNIAKVCLTYLTLDIYRKCPTLEEEEGEKNEEEGKEEFEEEGGFGFDDWEWREAREVKYLLNANPFFDYAALNWGHHVQGQERPLSNLITDFLLDDVKTSVAGKHLFAVEVKNGGRYNANGMILAAYFGLEDTISILVEKGGNVDTTCMTGQGALHWAVRRGSEAVIQLLLEKGSDIEAEDENHDRPLHWAAAWGQESAAMILLDYRVDINTRGRYGQTPLKMALAHDNGGIARLLIRNGANI